MLTLRTIYNSKYTVCAGDNAKAGWPMHLVTVFEQVRFLERDLVFWFSYALSGMLPLQIRHVVFVKRLSEWWECVHS